MSGPSPWATVYVWSSGMVQGLIHDIPTCAEMVKRIVAQAEAIIGDRLGRMRVGGADRRVGPSAG